MEKVFAKAEEIAAHVKEYVNNRIASVKLSAAEKSSQIIAGIIAVTIAVIFFIIFLLFISVAAAFALAKLTGEWYWGFLIVACIYLATGSFLWFAKEKILRLPIMNAMLKQLFKEENDDQNQEP